MKETIKEYCKREGITRSTFYYRLKMGYIDKERLSRNDGNRVIVYTEEEK